jgi:hypothetical protein
MTLCLFCHSSSDVLCFKAAVLFVQANLNFEWKLQPFINVLHFILEYCKKKKSKKI